jgi:hypothetical protein
MQQIVWSLGTNIPASAYLWGGGGGGGGNDSGTGGNGSGGGFSQIDFTLNTGDVIQVGVGSSGSGGGSGGGFPGGTAGASYTVTEIFNTRTATTLPAVFAQFNGRYCSFLNTYGVWTNPSSAQVFDRTYAVNFPISDSYQLVASADNSANIYIDNVLVLAADDYRSTYATTVFVTSGNHLIRIVGNNTGGPGAVALTITGGDSYGGGRGGNSGGSGVSGSGGGGGGATVVILNDIQLGAAGGGGGGGGAGNRGDRNGQSAPGPRGQASIGINAGQNGQDKGGDGGGAGGGGGGWAGGNGGTTPGGDVGAGAGAFGLSSSPAENPSGRVPGGTGSQYYTGSAGYGGTATANGNSGYAVFVFNIGGVFVHNNGSFAQVLTDWIKVENNWKQISSTYIKQNGVWQPVISSFSPIFNSISGNFGTNSRSA